MPEATSPNATSDLIDRDTLNSSKTIWSLILVAAISVLLIDALPALVIGMLSDLEFSEAQAGKISSAQLAGIGVGSFINLWLVNVRSWRWIARFGICCLLIADLASMIASEFTLFLLARFSAGVATGITVCICTYVVGKTDSPDRNFGLFFATQVLSGILANLLFPGWVVKNGIEVVFISFLVLELIALACLVSNIPNVSTHKVKDDSPHTTNSRGAWVLCALQLLTIAFFLPLLSNILTYIAPIGIAAGLSEQQAGGAVSIGLVAGMTGSFVAAGLGTRIGRLVPIAGAMALLFTSVAILYTGFDYYLYVLALMLYLFSWYMIYPYLLGMLAEIDSDGRPMILVNAVGGLGSATGPLSVAIFLNNDFLPVYIAAISYLFLSLLGVLVVIVGSTRI